MTGNDYFTLNDLELLGVAFDVIHEIDNNNEDRKQWLIQYQAFCEKLDDRAETKCSIKSLKEHLDKLMVDAKGLVDL